MQTKGNDIYKKESPIIHGREVRENEELRGALKLTIKKSSVVWSII